MNQNIFCHFSYSKQRHNKLWRSHSDSDLSEHHEPLSKSYAQPHSLGRCDPHNQAGSAPGPSVKELLESLGTGKAAHSSSQPDTGIHSSQLSASSAERAAVLSSVSVSPSREAPCLSAVAQSSCLAQPCPESTAGSVSPLSPPLSNGSCDSVQQPFSPPLSHPRAAIMMHEPHRTDIVTVVVGQPHPPPSLHHLPLSPALSPTSACVCEEVIKPQVLKTILASLPEPMTAQTLSAQQAGQAATVPDRKSDCDQQICGLSLHGLAAQPPSTSYFISCPSAIPQDKELLFGHSADHINFFSAREKFKEMSQDGKTVGSVVQQSPQKSCAKEQQPLLQDVSKVEVKEDERGKVRLP